MTPERLKEIQKLFENGGNDFLEQIEEIVPELLDSALRLAAIEGAGDEEVDRACDALRRGWWTSEDGDNIRPDKHIDAVLDVVASRNQVIADLRAKLGEAEKALGNLSDIPNSSEFLVTEADQREADRAITDGSAKLQLPETGHGITEVQDAAEGG